jgi:predicted nucleic acid-binding protein
MGHARYPNSPGTPAAVADILTKLRALTGHVFWPDDISLMNAKLVNMARLTNSAQVTDTYLLALAHAHNGKLATFDRKLVVSAVHSGTQAIHLI